MENALLEMHDMTAGYFKLPVINDISMQVRKDEITTIIGPNGSGKSTLLKSVCGLTKIVKGEVYYRGEKITKKPLPQLVKLGIGYVPQLDNIFTNMTVQENLEMGAYTRKDGHKIESSEILEMFPQLRERKQKAGTLSGGERQMLAIGRALMSQPKFLMMDEPTASLAPKAVSLVLEQIKKVRERGVTIVLVEQNVRESLAIADSCHVMVSGQLVLEGTPREILSNYDLGKVFLGARPEPKKAS